jgi:hypothetical protein
VNFTIAPNLKNNSHYAAHYGPDALIWSLYLKETEAEDRELVQLWQTGLDSLLVFVSLSIHVSRCNHCLTYFRLVCLLGSSLHSLLKAEGDCSRIQQHYQQVYWKKFFILFGMIQMCPHLPPFNHQPLLCL